MRDLPGQRGALDDQIVDLVVDPIDLLAQFVQNDLGRRHRSAAIELGRSSRRVLDDAWSDPAPRSDRNSHISRMKVK